MDSQAAGEAPTSEHSALTWCSIRESNSVSTVTMWCTDHAAVTWRPSRMELAFDKQNARATPAVFVECNPQICYSKASQGRHIHTQKVASLGTSRIHKQAPCLTHAEAQLPPHSQTADYPGVLTLKTPHMNKFYFGSCQSHYSQLAIIWISVLEHVHAAIDSQFVFI